jgi:hypothetical protein
VAATVRETLFLGNCIHVEAELADGRIVTAELPGLQDGFRRGERVQVWWRRDDELRFPQ